MVITSGWADHQEVMTACCCDFERALSRFLSLDVPEVGQAFDLLRDAGLGARQHLGALHVIDDLDEVLGRQDIDVGSRPCGLRP